MTARTGRRIAYLTSEYPRASDSFVRNEVAQLRKLGYVVDTYSIRRPDRGQLVDDDIREEHGRTDYLLEAGPAALARAVARAALGAPARMGSALRLALGTSLPGLRGRLVPLVHLATAAHLASRLEESGAGHLHSQIISSSSVAMLAAHLSGIPFSLTIHGPPEIDNPAELSLDTKIGRSSFTVAISEWTRSQLWRWCGYEHWDRLQIVRCGVDERFLDAEGQAVPAPLRLVSVGRLANQKGQLLLVSAFARLRDEGIDAELTLIGDGPMRGALEDLLRVRGLEGSVHMPGWASADEVREEILRSRAVVMASFAEGIPVVLMEALALHRPVIATYVGGHAELVEAERSGWLIPAGSEDALADAMRAALTADAASLQAMGEHGAARVRERHDVRAETARLAELIERPPGA